MRVVFCPKDHYVSMVSAAETVACPHCGGAVLETQMRRPWQYWANGAILLGVTAYLAVGNGDALQRWGLFLGGLAVVVALASWSLRSVRKRVLRKFSSDAGGGA